MGYFYMNGKQYEILGQINRQQRNTPANIKSIYIRSDKGEMIQLDNLVEFVESVAPPKLYHYNRFISATVSAGLADGKTIGQGLEEMDKIAAQTLDETFRTALSGDSKDYRESSSSLMFAFILALILIYLILGSTVRKFQGSFHYHAYRSASHCRSTDFHVCRRYHDEHIQPNRHYHVDRSSGKEWYFDCGIRQSEAGGRRKQDAGHPDAALQRLRPILMTSASTVLA
mgnify:FL=1